MGQIGEILGFGLQARIALDRGARTVEELLRETLMDGVDRSARRPSLKERLGLKGLGCCGATWGLGAGPTTMSVRDDDEEAEIDSGSGPPSPEITGPAQNIETGSAQPCAVQSPATTTGMNLAAALAAERQLRAATDVEPEAAEERSRAGTPTRVSLMRLLEETDGYDGGMGKEGGCDQVCCVCMGRKKGAAFIPCGHTFCRVCSREVWLNRGSCPLCNRSILEILDIY